MKKVRTPTGFLLALFVLLGLASQAQAQMAPSVDELAHRQLSLQLQATRDHLLTQNRRYQVPIAGMALGFASTILGAMLLVHSQDISDDWCESGPCDPDGVRSEPMRRAGLSLLPLGLLLLLVSPPMLVVRVVRHARLKKIDRELAWLSTHASLIPQLKSRQQAGVTASFRF
jgi:hypothetical protein